MLRRSGSAPAEIIITTGATARNICDNASLSGIVLQYMRMVDAADRRRRGKVKAMPDSKMPGMGRLKASGWFILALFIGSAALAQPCAAGMPLVSQTDVTDVTPRSFAVSWVSSEPAVGGLNLFQGDCVTPVAGPLLTAQGNDLTGIIKVTVSGLTADRAYCYQTVTTSKSSSETALVPASPVPVSTKKAITREMVSGGKTVPFANDVLWAPTPYLRNPSTDTQDGLLLVLQLLDGKGDKPVSLLLSTDVTLNYFNMNNLFDPVSGQNANLTGGERIKVTERHGNGGCVSLERFRKVPSDLENASARDMERGTPLSDIDCNNAVNVLDIIRVARSNGAADGDLCFNNDLDITGDGRVDLLDVEAVIGGFSETP